MTLPTRTVTGRNANGQPIDTSSQVASAPVWLRCNPDGSVIWSAGVASVSRISAGRYQVNFVTPITSAQYACSVSLAGAQYCGAYDYTASSVKVFIGDTGVDMAFSMMISA